MAGDYHCAFCETEFHQEDGDDDPNCPTCGQTESVKPVDDFALVSDIRRQWYAVFAVLFVAGAAFAAYQWLAVSR
ncbi:MAG: hypothetical protein AAGF92_02845 [Myxococcota bacterium]